MDPDIQYVGRGITITDVDNNEIDLTKGPNRNTQYVTIKTDAMFTQDFQSAIKPLYNKRVATPSGEPEAKRRKLPSAGPSSRLTPNVAGPSKIKIQVYDLDGDGLEVIDPKIYKAEQEEQYEEEGYENAIPNYMFKPIPKPTTVSAFATHYVPDEIPPRPPCRVPDISSLDQSYRNHHRPFDQFQARSQPRSWLPIGTPLLPAPEPTKSYHTELSRGAGSINKILQHHGAIIVATSVANGGDDDVDLVENPYNKSGSLKIWQPSKVAESYYQKPPRLKEIETRQELEARRLREGNTLHNPGNFFLKFVDEHTSNHTAYKLKDSDTGSFRYCYPSSARRRNEFEIIEKAVKARSPHEPTSEYEWQEHHYLKLHTVNSLACHRQSGMVASSGTDKMIRLHSLLEDEAPLEPIEFDHEVPHELAFDPTRKDPILAIAGEQLEVHYNPFSVLGRSQTTFRMCSSGGEYRVGPLNWGRGPTASYLYASIEADANKAGSHRAFDLRGTSQTSYEFDNNEAGDEIAISYDGSTLALVTVQDTWHSVRLYDIARKSFSRCTTKLELEPFSADLEHREVNNATFSPDGIYLAVSRSDNTVHVYDSRWDGRLLHKFRHGSSKDVCNSACGVVRSEWVSRSKSGGSHGLVSGGEDGCVRLWDVSVAAGDRSNGLVMAEIDAEVGYFSLGDRYREERDLIIGGSDGTVSVYDNLSCFLKINDDIQDS